MEIMTIYMSYTPDAEGVRGVKRVAQIDLARCVQWAGPKVIGAQACYLARSIAIKLMQPVIYGYHWDN